MADAAGIGGTSRYATGSSNPYGTNNVDAKTLSSGSTSGQSNTSGSTSGTQWTVSDQTQRTNSNTQNMDSTSLAQLDQLIKMLSTGGTDAMKRTAAARQGEIGAVQDIRSGYSKEAAFGDAQGLISQQMRRVLEQLLPSISRAAEDAGSSGGALRALLLQDAAAKAAESSSALGVQTAGQYGNITANLSQVLERLTAGGDAATDALISALGVAKGSVQNTKGTVNTFGSSTTQSQQNTNQSTNTTQQSNESKSIDYAPFSLVTQPASQNLYFGAMPGGTVDGSKYIGTTQDTLSQLAGTGNPWNSYTSF